VSSGRLFNPASALALCAALAGVAAGCGGGSKPAASTTTSPRPAASTTAAAGSLVAPEGAAYSYRVPEGFKLVPGRGPGQRLTTLAPAYLPTGSGTISAFELTPGENLAGAHAAERFLRAFGRQTVAFYRSRGGAVAPGTRTTIAGHPALCLRVSHFDNSYNGVVDGEGCTIVAGSVVVQQGCNWKPNARAMIAAGCKAMRASLRIS
jgi:hypothetical protein